MTPRLRRILGGLALAVVLPTVSLCTWITWSGSREDRQHADCIIVPGARCDANGHLGMSLTARVDHAIELFHEGWSPHIIFTGGQGASGPIESECARDYAVSHGVPLDAIYIERLSHDTEANFHQAAAIMLQNHWSTCLISTDPFHSTRCLRIARDEGLTAWSSPAFDSPSWHRPGIFCYYTLRECSAWVKYVLRRNGLYREG